MVSRAVAAGTYVILLGFVAGLLNSVVRVECGAAAAGVDESLIILENSTNFTTVLSLLRGTGIDLALEALQQVTFLAPSDAAFRLLPNGELGTLHRDTLLDILRLHAVPAYLPISALANATSVASFAGPVITFSRPSRSSLTVQCASFPSADVVSSVFDRPPVAVYSVDRVLLPPTIAPPIPPESAPAPFISPGSAPAPLTSAPAPGNFEWAPSRSAPAPAINSISAPPPAISPDSAPAPAFAPSISRVLENVSGFNTIVSLLAVTRLAESLDSVPALTFLAPPDDAFLSLGKESLRNLSDPELMLLLKYHALPAFFQGFEPGRALPTVASGVNGGFRLHIRPHEVGRSESAIVDTGAELVNILGPLFIRSPRLAVYAVDKVLVPLELSALMDLRPIATPELAPIAPFDEVAVDSSASFRAVRGLAGAAFMLWLFKSLGI